MRSVWAPRGAVHGDVLCLGGGHLNGDEGHVCTRVGLARTGCSPSVGSAPRLCRKPIAPPYFLLSFISTHGSGEASISVRVDFRFRSKLVLRFKPGRCVNHLSPGKLILYLRLKFFILRYCLDAVDRVLV